MVVHLLATLARLMRPGALGGPKCSPKIAVAIKPSTLLKFHQTLVRLKHHLLYTARRRHPSRPNISVSR